jgi:hypothetical protein
MAAERPRGEWQPSVPYTHKAFRPYVAALGQLTLAWNDLHLALAMLFCTVMGGGFSNPFLAIWHTLKSDRAQRDILLAAVTATLQNGDSQNLAEEITWICQRADVLEENRNNALHSPLWGTPRDPDHTVVTPVVGLGHVRANKLFGKNLLFEFRWVEMPLPRCAITRPNSTSPSIEARHCHIDRNCQIAGVPMRRNRPAQLSKQNVLASFHHL